MGFIQVERVPMMIRVGQDRLPSTDRRDEESPGRIKCGVFKLVDWVDVFSVQHVHLYVRVDLCWGHALWDAKDYMQKCRKCQEYSRMPHCLPKELMLIYSPWSFAQWGIDLVGPLPPGKGGVKFVVVAVYYFTKWVEAEALATITTSNIMRFLWRLVVCKFGVPRTIISDNGRQFDSEHYCNWCRELGVEF
ncbi:uncharacterized protein K02A2.6-like [Juglans microcarpa x Juglans regia]|uniref:uncharacterized protein K02A2.6-like n=1 Tax=Juglans microcarpa x Juglans regia TaxID=2249226 RepID=UPI001B7E814D|nr:uncharacterized protein K02A2.6-like [Juglans microcarpa x Juglans regia]